MMKKLGLALVAASIGVTGCSDDNPGSPTFGDPKISCPAPITVTTQTGAPVAVNYDPPVVIGEAPTTTTCTPPTGSAFSRGTTTVTCSVRDAQQRAASCSFNVTVTGPTPRLTVSKFLAFGDSITAGVIPTDCPAGAPIPTSRAWLLADALKLQFNASPGLSYPDVLTSRLTANYAGQTFTMVNEGFGGKLVTDPTELPRLQAALSANSPEVLLLQEGINDIHMYQTGGITPLVNGLQGMIRTARQRNVAVFLGTLLPQRAGFCRAFDTYQGDPDDIVPANTRIRSLAVQEGATLVDLYPVIQPQVSVLISGDGLHPNATGYRSIADVFYEAIRSKYETLQPRGVGGPAGEGEP